MNLTIAILNWNGKKLLETCLPSVVEHSEGASIVIIDNNSSDGSIEYLKESFSSVRIIQLDSNYGFAGGYNEGLKQIDSELICLLNNDVQVSPGWLMPIKKAFENSVTGLIQPKIKDYYNRDKFEYAGACGGFIDKYGFPFCRGRIFETIEKDKGQYNDELDIFWASGACLFIRKSIFEELGGFDKRFFAHMEEIDLCWRARIHGYEAKCIPDSVIYHMGGATLTSLNPRKTYLNFRNSLIMLVKNLPTSKLFPVLFIRLMQDGIAAVKFFIQADVLHSFAVLRSHFSFYIYLFRLLRERDSVKRIDKYYMKTSIVWSYFVNGIRTFDRL